MAERRAVVKVDSHWLEKEAVLKAVDDEEELNDGMPDAMWEAIRNDRDAMAECLRLSVRMTKDNIKERLKKMEMLKLTTSEWKKADNGG